MNAARSACSCFLLVAVACGGARSEPDAPAASAGASEKPARDDQDLAGAPVYDNKGKQKPCEMPIPTCPEPARDREFLDRCTLTGYQVRRCGCELVCSGNVMVEKPYYDAKGKQRRCEKERKDCAPPDTSASFQDACNDGGNRLVVCGCEWLCTGPLKGAPGAAD